MSSLLIQFIITLFFSCSFDYSFFFHHRPATFAPPYFINGLLFKVQTTENWLQYLHVYPWIQVCLVVLLGRRCPAPFLHKPTIISRPADVNGMNIQPVSECIVRHHRRYIFTARKGLQCFCWRFVTCKKLSCTYQTDSLIHSPDTVPKFLLCVRIFVHPFPP